MRGGDPKRCRSVNRWLTFYPHARGWSLNKFSFRNGIQVLPACAGVIPFRRLLLSSKVCFTRMRGGDPVLSNGEKMRVEFYPHARGWSRLHQYSIVQAIVLPACAGVILILIAPSSAWSCFTRMRGGDPDINAGCANNLMFYPHARGWSQITERELNGYEVLPACAGVIPRLAFAIA